MKTIDKRLESKGIVIVTNEELVPRSAVLTPDYLEERLDMMSMEISILVAQAISKSAGGLDLSTKPLLRVSEAASVLGVSTKRLTNILYEEKARLGRFPDFVCDAGGTIQRRIITEELLKWARRSKRRTGRPFKNERRS